MTAGNVEGAAAYRWRAGGVIHQRHIVQTDCC